MKGASPADKDVRTAMICSACKRLSWKSHYCGFQNTKLCQLRVFTGISGKTPIAPLVNKLRIVGERVLGARLSGGTFGERDPVFG